MIQRKYIEPGTRLTFRLSRRERDLVVERAFLAPEIEALLRSATVTGSKLEVALTLDDLDDLHGCVAAEANHCDDAKVRRILDAVCDRLGALEGQFTDEVATERAAVQPSTPKFTPKQGQYLAFMYYFTKLHGRPPAEADLQQYFKVSPPVVHQMILALERRGFITRVPGKARSVGLRVARSELPELE
jgi:repressor LexA